ncbi:hypothetical protein ACWED2_23415 [Amycolatopsis sp. NPDC005003]
MRSTLPGGLRKSTVDGRFAGVLGAHKTTNVDVSAHPPAAGHDARYWGHHQRYAGRPR